jgi:L-fuculose-phosphate aldolase
VSIPVSRSFIESLVREVLARHAALQPPADLSPQAAFDSEAAQALKREMVDVGRKLWERQYVDGNGGNVSCRLTDQWVLCTPTLTSKADLAVEDLCLVDFDGRQVAGRRRRSSEILLHLEVMKAVPEARAVVHCHPPHATAYSLAGLVPPEAMLAEHEVFVGPVAIVPYESPGTQAFADAIIPLVQQHNTILLANHGLVTWGDTLTHAEWYVEVMDTTCRILILAGQLGAPLRTIPADKLHDLLAFKKRLGMPDARFAPGESPIRGAAGAATPAGADMAREDIAFEDLVKVVTDQVLAALTHIRQ